MGNYKDLADIIILDNNNNLITNINYDVGYDVIYEFSFLYIIRDILDKIARQSNLKNISLIIIKNKKHDKNYIKIQKKKQEYDNQFLFDIYYQDIGIVGNNDIINFNLSKLYNYLDLSRYNEFGTIIYNLINNKVDDDFKKNIKKLEYEKRELTEKEKEEYKQQCEKIKEKIENYVKIDNVFDKLLKERHAFVNNMKINENLKAFNEYEFDYSNNSNDFKQKNNESFFDKLQKLSEKEFDYDCNKFTIKILNCNQGDLSLSKIYMNICISINFNKFTIINKNVLSNKIKHELINLYINENIKKIIVLKTINAKYEKDEKYNDSYIEFTDNIDITNKNDKITELCLNIQQYFNNRLTINIFERNDTNIYIDIKFIEYTIINKKILLDIIEREKSKLNLYINVFILLLENGEYEK